MGLIERFRLRRKKKDFSVRQSNTGLGGINDKGTNMSLQIPWQTRTPVGLSAWHKNSWVCRDVVNKPAEDATNQWRVFNSDESNEDRVRLFKDSENTHNVKNIIFEATWKARLYGGVLLCMITKEADLTEPLDLRKIKKGDLINLHVVNRFYVNAQRDFLRDIMQPDFNEPDHYDVWQDGINYRIHPSRTVRVSALPVDNVTPSVMGQDLWFGDSVLHTIIDEVTRDLSMAQASGHLIQEGSVKVLGIDNLNDMRAGRTSGNTDEVQSLDSLLSQLSREISLYNTFVIDKEDTNIQRMEAKVFSGLDKVLKYQQQRISGATGIPSTILWGSSPDGMNATGDSDMKIYQRLIENTQKRMIDPIFRVLDPVLIADAGGNFNQVLEYKWPKIIEKNALLEAQASKTKVEGLVLLKDHNAIDEDEIRRTISGDPSYAEFLGASPEMDEEAVTDMQNEVARLREDG